MRYIVIFALSFLFFFSCKKTTQSPAKTTTSITGKWKTVADTLRIYINGSFSKEYSFTDSPSELADYQFNTDGTLLVTNQTDPTNVSNETYTVNGNTITFNHPSQVVQGGTIPGYSQSATIKQLTSNKLVIFFDDKYNADNGTAENDQEIVYLAK